MRLRIDLKILIFIALFYFTCKAYDNVCLKEEAERLTEEESAPAIAESAAAPAAAAPATDNDSELVAQAKNAGKQLKVLVLCAGAGTSALLANALKDGAASMGLDMATNAGAYGSHYDIMSGYDVIVLAPQVRTYYNEMKADTDRLGIKLLSPRGKEYIDLTNDPEGAVEWILKNLED